MSEKWLRIPPFSAPRSFTLSPAQWLLKVYSRLDVHSLVSVTQRYPAPSTSLTKPPLSFSLLISFLSCYECDIVCGYTCLSSLSLLLQFPQWLWLTPRLTSIPHPHSLCLVFSDASKRSLIPTQVQFPISFQYVLWLLWGVRAPVIPRNRICLSTASERIGFWGILGCAKVWWYQQLTEKGQSSWKNQPPHTHTLFSSSFFFF